MLSNFHTHTTFCDGNHTAEEMVLSAISKGFDSFGFSGHGYTDFDLSYCMRETDEYIKTVKFLKEKYKDKIQVYLGVEEDAYCPVKNRGDFDYIIGSCHYIKKDFKYYAVDHSKENFEEILKLFNGDLTALAESYYSNFVDYINLRKPDIIGHFDLITKYKEVLNLDFNMEYKEIAAKYIKEAIKSDCIFEVNTGAISRGVRTTPYPDTELLHILKKENGKVILSADTHHKDTIDCCFNETRHMLKDIGFQYVYFIYNNEFVKDEI